MPKRKRCRVHRDTSHKRQRLSGGIVRIVILVSAFVAVNTLPPLGSEALAQQNLHAGHAQPPAPLLDGSEHPALIPDDVAIRVLMQTLRLPPNPDTLPLKQLHARIHRAKLSDSDLETLVRQLGILDTQAKAQEARIETVRPAFGKADRAAFDRYVGERKRLESLIVHRYELLLASLSPEGAAKLKEHLLHVKSRIKIYPTPDMTANIR